MAIELDDKKYRTCCCHVRTCALVIGILELIWLVLGLISVIVKYGTKWVPHDEELFSNRSDNATVLPFSPAAVSAGSVTMCVIGLIVVPLLLFGVLKGRHIFLIPHMVYQVIMMIMHVAYMILFGLGAVVVSGALAGLADNADERRVIAGVTIGVFAGLIILMIISLLLEIYFFIVIFKCYRYFKDKWVSGGVDPYRTFG